ncbi:haloacid dehalogenase-like hydrolase [Gracilaria domingensis]|nr:haloacid dehalogenase-like hydrolase [Gracilaria domingensis]
MGAEISAAGQFARSLGLPCWDDGESVEVGFQGREELKPAVESFMRGVTEIIPRGVGKGVALDFFMDNDASFCGKFVVYFGDDANDIPAGRAAQRRAGLLVWVGDYAAAVDAAADYYVADPAAVEHLLLQLCTS